LKNSRGGCRRGATVALLFAIIEALGLLLIWFSPSALLRFAGAALAGFGYSLVYPGLGVKAVRRSPADSRGLAIGVYTAFLDVALGVLSPALGVGEAPGPRSSPRSATPRSVAPALPPIWRTAARLKKPARWRRMPRREPPSSMTGGRIE
jgi:MFS family permease